MNNTLYNVLIFDVYNVFYRVFWKNDELTKIENKMIPMNAVCKFFELSNGYIKKFGTSDCKVYWLFDNAKSSLLKNRKELDEDYKKARKIQPDYFYDALNIVELILKFYRNNSFIYRKQGVEADDFVNPIIDSYAKEHDKILMFSTDMDWCRALLMDDVHDIKVEQYTKNNEIFNVKSFEEKYEFKPTYTNVIFYKSFYGDDSDCILPCLNNFPKKYFKDVISKYSHVSQFISDALNGKIKYLDNGWIYKIQQVAERLMLNWNLISSMDLTSEELETWKIECSYKPNKLNIIYNSLNVIGKFDDRIKNEDKSDGIWSMVNGEELNRG